MTITNQDGKVRLTPRNYAVDQVAQVGLGSFGDRVRTHYFHVVRRRCGESQAERTWVVLIDLTRAQLVLPPITVLTSPTRKGWKVTLHESAGWVRATKHTS